MRYFSIFFGYACILAHWCTKSATFVAFCHWNVCLFRRKFFKIFYLEAYSQLIEVCWPLTGQWWRAYALNGIGLPLFLFVLKRTYALSVVEFVWKEGFLNQNICILFFFWRYRFICQCPYGQMSANNPSLSLPTEVSTNGLTNRWMNKTQRVPFTRVELSRFRSEKGLSFAPPSYRLQDLLERKTLRITT